jgi:filamentous hemagglutinin family protein
MPKPFSRMQPSSGILSRRETSWKSGAFRKMGDIGGRWALLSGVSALTLLASGTAEARGMLAGGAGSSIVTSAMAAATASTQQAAAMAQRTQSALSRATQAIQAMQAMQAAARNLTLTAPSPVPDGLGAGGLQIAPGAAPGSTLWQNAQAPVQSTNGGQTTVTIQQTAPKAILNWQSFNVGRHTTVDFEQQGNADWVALNRVLDPSGVPSQILGSIKADGAVYLINQNGIIFGGSATVNTHTLVASAVGLSDSQFLAGIVNQQAYTASNSVGTITPPAFSNTSGTTGDVIVQAGAIIQTAPPSSVTTGGGSVYLFGANVENDGMISTPDGQTVLAAAGQASIVTLPAGSTGVPGSTSILSPGRSDPQDVVSPSDVYLTASTNPNIRGVTVLMDNGGTATNNGVILAPTGNITVTGMNVRQSDIGGHDFRRRSRLHHPVRRQRRRAGILRWHRQCGAPHPVNGHCRQICRQCRPDRDRHAVGW